MFIELVCKYSSALNIVLWFLFLGILDQLPKVTLHKDPAFDTMFVGELVSFTCNMNVPTNVTYKWLKDGNMVSLEGGNYITFPLVASSGGNYSCQATRGATEVTSEERLQRVIGQ